MLQCFGRHAANPAHKEAGIYWMDMKTGQNKLIVSIAWAAANQPDKRFEPGAHHWFNHLLVFTADSERFPRREVRRPSNETNPMKQKRGRDS